ncbi:hypothetical protein [Embleya hyalina]|uniref:hypothetical protein n=1 Tax=Embleya hyalina TaxID=516124 RepID=UPI000F832F29|nr:hypothetical protein [Embleya hyalina]
MESISVDLLSGLAAGAGGDAGRLAWTRLVELVRMPLPDTGGPGGSGESAASGARGEGDMPHRSAPVPTGELELTLLGHEAPGGLRAYTRAYALAGALALRAERDPDFARSIAHWYAEARRIGLDGSDASGQGAGPGSGGRGGCCGRGGHGVIVLGEGVDGLDGPFRLGPAGHSGGWAAGGDPEGAEGVGRGPGSAWPADGVGEDGEAGAAPG